MKNPHLEHLYIWRAITYFKIMNVYHYYQSDYGSLLSVSAAHKSKSLLCLGSVFPSHFPSMSDWKVKIH